jgi:hypothetical protein
VVGVKVKKSLNLIKTTKFGSNFFVLTPGIKMELFFNAEDQIQKTGKHFAPFFLFFDGPFSNPPKTVREAQSPFQAF